MTPRIPRGWTRVYERGEGVWFSGVLDRAWRIAKMGGPLSTERTYIRRTDPSVSADPNEALRLEDEAARLEPNAGQMVPGMMMVDNWWLVPLSQVRIGGGSIIDLGGVRREMPEAIAAYTAAWEYTERRRAEIAEEARRAGEPPAPDLDEWPGKPDVPPIDGYGVEILTAHGVCHGCYNGTWRAFVRAIDDERPMQDVSIDPRDVLRWRYLPRAVVVGGRVTGVARA